MRLKPLAQRGKPQEEVEIARKRLGDARPQHLDRDIAPVGRPGEMDLGDRRRRDRRCRRTTRTVSRAAARTRPRSARAPRVPETAAAGPAGCARSRVISSPKRSARVDGSWPSLMKLGPNSLECRGEPLTRARRGGGSAARRAAADPQEGRGGRKASSGNSASCRASVSPIRISRARLRTLRNSPNARPERVRGARPNGAQRCPGQVAQPHLIEPGARDHFRRARFAAGSAGCFRRDRCRPRDRR